MKILKLLNKKFLTIILTFLLLFTQSVESTEPVDIWNLESEKDINEIKDIEEDESTETITNSIYEMQSQKKNDSEIQEDETLLSAKKEIIGLYDPEENNLTMEMWLNSDGEKILNLLNKIQKIKLSNDAKEIMNIALLTNSYFPEKNISKEVFLKFKSNWLIKNNDLKLMEEYLIKNQNVDENLKIIKFLVDDYLSKSELEKACNIFSKLNGPINDDYLFKFQTYCLINDNKKEQAQLLLDLKKELGFEDIFFEKKFNYLIGYDVENDQKISEKSILEFHLSHRTNINFEFEPSETTSSKIWRYLSTSNLLDNIKDVNLEDQNKINIIEKATHDGNYLEKELYDLYKRFQFNINQLLSVKAVL